MHHLHYLYHKLAWIRCQNLDIQVVVVDTVSLPSLVVHCHRVVVVIVIQDNLGVVVAAVAVADDRMDFLPTVVVETVRDIHPLVIRKGFDSQRLMQSKSPMSLRSSTLLCS